MKKKILLLVFSLFILSGCGYSNNDAVDYSNAGSIIDKSEEENSSRIEDVFNNLGSLVYPEEKDISDKKIVLEYSSTNYAWARTYMGNVIFDDGTIYSYDVDFQNLSENTDIGDLDDRINYIFEYGIKENRRVSTKDLEKIQDITDKLFEDEPILETKNMGADIGITKVIVYRDNIPLVISVSGDSYGQLEGSDINFIMNKVRYYFAKMGG